MEKSINVAVLVGSLHASCRRSARG